jgi:phosphotransferase system enzyme I (PtsP)
MALIGLGFRSISMSAAAIGPVKAMLVELDVAELESVLAPALGQFDGESRVRDLLRHFAADREIPL